MRADQEAFRDKLYTMDRGSLITVAMEYYVKYNELRLRSEANDRIAVDSHKQYAEMKDMCERLCAENAVLKAELEKERAKYTELNRNRFGRKTETLGSMTQSAGHTEPDPLDEEAPSQDADHEEASSGNGRPLLKYGMPKTAGTKARSRRHGGRRKLDESKLPVKEKYEFHPDVYDRLFGKENWSFYSWDDHDTIERMPVQYYIKRIMTPVLSVGLEHVLVRPDDYEPFLAGSHLSASLVAELMYNKQGLALPYNRQADEYRRLGLSISKQTIIRNVNALALGLMPVYNHLISYIVNTEYNQCDETTAEVINDGRKPGSKSYMWVHITSEHYTGHPAVVFCFELTRGTDHLRHFYQDFIGYITCDAYISYQVLESESGGNITVSGCLMHCRRYFAIAFFMNDVSSMTDDEIQELPEMKVLMKIAEVYSVENTLKDMTAEDRLAVRIEKEKPLMDELFDYIEALDKDDNTYSYRLQKAITYALNQKEHLLRYLEDGNIPIDDGNTERSLKGYCTGRRNWLFYDTVDGAEASAIIYTMVETARLNGVDARMYLQYLLEKMSAHKNEEHSSEFLDTMMPWSDEFSEYETDKKKEAMVLMEDFFRKPEKPRTPRKKDRLPKDLPPDRPPDKEKLPLAV